LFLNGKFAHQGLKSSRIVHPGQVSASFGGRLGTVQQVARALTDDELHAWPESSPRPDGPLPVQAVEIVADGEDQIAGRFWQPGRYTLTNAKGEVKSVEVTGISAPQVVEGPWQVTFQAPGGSSRTVTFDALDDWTKHAEEPIRYFSGTAVYRQVFTLPEPSPGRTLRLELGEVRGIASVRLNGRDLGTRWIEPWQFDITAAAQSGQNVLEVDVVNPWQNRLVGDAKLPPEQRQTFLLRQTVPENLPLKPAGLLGPVTVSGGETRELESGAKAP
jgi:hypothetical protein